MSTERTTTLTMGSTSAWYYARHRTGYPPELVDRLATSVGSNTCIADIGCGTGELAIPLALHGLRVFAVDPSTEMIKELYDRASALGIDGAISCVLGRGECLASIIDEELSLVVFGRSFHLIEREQMLRDCDALLSKEGAVIVIRASWPKGQPEWMRAGHCVSLLYSAGSGDIRGFQAPPPPSTITDEQVLSTSAFRFLRKQWFDVDNSRNLEQAVGFHFAMPDCSPSELTSTKLAGFEAELRARLIDVCPDGVFKEQYRFEVIEARREPHWEIV